MKTHDDPQTFWHQLKAQLDQLPQTDEPRLHQKPSPKKWSAAETLEHVLITARMYNQKLSLVKGESPAKAEAIPKFSLMGKWFVNFLSNPNSKGVSSPGKFKPSANQSQGWKIDEMRDALDIMLEHFERIKAAGLLSKKFSSPVTFLIRFHGQDAVWINLYHLQRHMDQIDRALKAVADLSDK